MAINGWLRGHPLLYALVGAAVGVFGAVRGAPIAIAIGILVVLYGLFRAFVF